MKKILMLVLTLAIVLACAAPALADMGLPTVDPYDVVVGPAAAEISYWDNGVEKKTTIPAGTRVTVESELDDDIYFYYNDSFVNLNKSKVVKAGETVSPDYATKKLEKPVKGTITADDGLIIRSGPSTGYDAKGLIPFKAEVSYSQVFSEGLDWAYVTYDGVSGWACVDYIAAVPEPEPEETKPEEEQTMPAEQTTAADTQSTTAADTQEAKPETKPEAKHGSVISGILTVMICIVLVLAAALAALLLLLRSKKRREAAEAEQDEFDQATGRGKPSDDDNERTFIERF